MNAMTVNGSGETHCWFDARSTLQSNLQAEGLAVEVETWEELSSFYRQVRGLFDLVFTFLLAIVIAVVVMSVANAIA
jgi:putative ABC transport system permease protein